METVSFIDFIHENFPEENKEKLKAKICAGAYRVNAETVYDPWRQVRLDSRLEVNRKPYVSRGGQKLKHALKHWKVDVRNKVFVDAGASTGGFTDCLLQFGARLVHTVDVGYNQLDYSLRSDKRVVVHERTNIMDCTELEPPPDAAVGDLAFRSIVPVAERLLKLSEERWAIVLIKPQFEYTEAGDDFTGVVKERRQVREILRDVARRLQQKEVLIKDLCESPISGRKGNMEVFAWIKPLSSAINIDIPCIDVLIERITS